MGIRGFLRDLIFIFIGIRIILHSIFPISQKWIFAYGLLIFITSTWFTLERVGIIGR